MKFWQKMLVLMLLVFVITLDACLLFFLGRNWASSLEREVQRAKNEQILISNNLLNGLDSIQLRNAILTDQMLFDLVHAYSRFYNNQGVELLVWKEGKQLFPATLDSEQPYENGLQEIKMNEEEYIQIAGDFPEPFQDIKLIYRRNIQPIYDNQQELNKVFALVNIIACTALGIVLYIIIRKLTVPLRELSISSDEIAGGNYENRVKIHGNDEFADLANSFNTMADSIEENILALSQSLESKQRMVDNLAHELRTPLTAMQGYSDILLSGNLEPEEQQKALVYINSETKRLRQLAFKLLEMALTQNHELQWLEIDTKTLFERAIAQSQPSLNEKNICVKVYSEVETNWGDADLLHSFLVNAIENACHASNNDSEIFISAYTEDDHIVLEIQDEGKGMTVEEIEKAFEPFYRADKSRSRKHGGAGLGLSLSKQIADLHGATLQLESKINKGTSIRMILQLDNNSTDTP